eukprot:2959610-Pyramimonas_sp.AAC.1
MLFGIEVQADVGGEGPARGHHGRCGILYVTYSLSAAVAVEPLMQTQSQNQTHYSQTARCSTAFGHRVRMVCGPRGPPRLPILPIKKELSLIRQRTQDTKATAVTSNDTEESDLLSYSVMTPDDAPRGRHNRTPRGFSVGSKLERFGHVQVAVGAATSQLAFSVTARVFRPGDCP